MNTNNKKKIRAASGPKLRLMIQLIINNKTVSVSDGNTVATAIFASEADIFRRSISGQPRFPLCGMGICFECRVTINGAKHQRSCQILAEEGMKIETDE
jgi:predicted molibdopterin-dependent oxidoreductase YjgC